jgi:hypothetical protein
VPEADRELAPIQVVLNGKDRRKSMERQGKAPHGRASKQLPALFFSNQILPDFHVLKQRIR